MLNNLEIPEKLRQAAALIEKGDLMAAERLLVPLCSANPPHPEALRLFGIVSHLTNRFEQAIKCFRQALAAQPNRSVLHNNLGSALRAAGNFAAAVGSFRKALELDPRSAAAWFNLGKTYKQHALLAEALSPLQEAVRLAPSHDAAGIMLGDVYKALGRIDEAEKAYRRVLEFHPRQATAWWALSNLKTVRFTAGDVERMRSILPGADGEQQSRLLFALFRALDDLGEYESAFRYLQQGNAAMRARFPWNAADFSRRTAEISLWCRRSMTPPTEVQLKEGQGVIFIVGMPRSGSTLLEQMLASHSALEGASELGDLPNILIPAFKPIQGSAVQQKVPWSTADWLALGNEYWRRTARWRPQNCRWFIDKLPNNWQWCEAILRLLPQAIVIDCRREAKETIFSNYAQLFARGQEFSYDLDSLWAYRRDYEVLMDDLVRRYPRRVLQIRYESLVQAPEETLRPLFSVLDVPWEEACLKFYETDRTVRTASAGQVRQPLYRAARKRSEEYARWLDVGRRSQYD